MIDFKQGIIVSLLLTCLCLSNLAQGNNWSLKASKEPNCLKCNCMGTPLDEKYRPSVLKILSQTHYNPLDSMSSSMYLHVVLHGPNLDVKKNLCVKQKFDVDSGVYFLDSNGINVTYKLSIKTLSKISLYNIEQRHDPSEMSEDLATSYRIMTAPKKESIAWTDGKTTVLSTVCRWDGQTTWYVSSTLKALSKKQRKTILKKVKGLGFDVSKAVESSDYNQCP